MKHKKLRNGYGSIKFLGKSRSCPYGVYAPATFDEDGKPHQKPLGYVRTWEEGFAMLTAYSRMETLNHSPHDTRHTFSTLCERFSVPEADRKRLMGHSFGGDITSGVYGHRTVEELRESIEMIRVPNELLTRSE